MAPVKIAPGIIAPGKRAQITKQIFSILGFGVGFRFQGQGKVYYQCAISSYFSICAIVTCVIICVIISVPLLPVPLLPVPLLPVPLLPVPLLPVPLLPLPSWFHTR